MSDLVTELISSLHISNTKLLFTSYTLRIEKYSLWFKSILCYHLCIKYL